MSALGKTGVDYVHVWAFPSGGGDPVWVGWTYLNATRSDVSAILGNQYLQSGYELYAATIPTGTYSLVAYAHSSVTNSFSQWALHTITVQ